MNNPMSGSRRPARSVHSRFFASVLFWTALGVAHGQTAPETHAVGAPIHTFSISPAAVTVQLRGRQQFVASNSEAVVWEVNGTAGGSADTGTITQSGLYTAPTSLAKSSRLVITARAGGGARRARAARGGRAGGGGGY